MRVPGHTLVSEGAPFIGRDCDMPWCTGLGKPGTRGWRHRTSGQGHGQCSCGAESEHLHSTRARKAWHRQHKISVSVA